MYLTSLPTFTTPKPRLQSQYDAVKGLVIKLAGSDEPEIVSSFLRSQFDCLNQRKINWSFIFDHADELKSTSNTFYS